MKRIESDLERRTRLITGRKKPTTKVTHRGPWPAAPQAAEAGESSRIQSLLSRARQELAQMGLLTDRAPHKPQTQEAA